MNAGNTGRISALIREEFALFAGIVTTLLFIGYGDAWLMDLSQVDWYLFLFGWLFLVMLWLAFNVVRHADCLAILLGEP